MALPLTPKQLKFIAAYLGSAHGNATEAARQADYSGNDHVLRQVGYENLTKPDIALVITKAHEAIAQQGIADKRNRINAYDERWKRLHQVIEARAVAHNGDAPGAESGWLVRTYKQVGQGPMARLMEEWAVDTGLLSEMRALEQQAAREMGQWVDKIAPTNPTGDKSYEHLSDDELDQRLRAVLAADTSTPAGKDPAH